MQATNPNIRYQRGLTLLEVLIALVVLSIGLLGLAGLQAHGLQTNTSAYQTSHSVIAAEALLDAMRADRNNALEGAYDVDFSASADTVNGDGYANQVLAQWLTELEATLPGIADDDDLGLAIDLTDDVVSVRIRWYDERWEEGDSDDAASGVFPDGVRTVELETSL